MCDAQRVHRRVYWLRRQLGRYFLLLCSWALAGYGYRPLWTFGWYLSVIAGCALLYYLLADMLVLDSIVGSVTAFHGRGLFNSQANSWQGIIASFEAFLGLVIEVAFIVTFTQRFFGK